jgi:inorganic pyrophosphatase
LSRDRSAAILALVPSRSNASSALTLARLAPHDARTRRPHVVVETPGGSRNKYRYDESLGAFVLHKRLPLGAAFPFDFGFVPGTRAEDGDPIDVLVVDELPTFAGCVVPVRLLGVLEANQTEKGRTLRNDRLIAVAETEKIHPAQRSLADLQRSLLDQIEHFFAAYNLAEGRTFEVIGRGGHAVAKRLLDRAIDAHAAHARRRARR